MNTIIPISLIKKKEYEDYTNREKLPLLRLDSTYLLNLKVYSHIMQQAKDNKIDVFSIEEIGKLRKGQEKEGGVKAFGIMVKSIAKLTIHLLKLEVKSVSQSSLVNPYNIAIISTGIGSIGRSGLVPRFLHKLIEDLFDEKLPVSVTQHVIKFELERKDVSPYYIIALLNSFYGKMLIEGIATYGATGQLEVHIPILSKLKVPIVDIQNKVAKTVMEALEEYESKAWRAYFNAMKIVEEYLGKPEELVFSVVRARDIEKTTRFRIDPSRLLILGVVSKLISKYGGRVHKVSDLLEVHTTGVPREKRYKVKEGQHPLITIDSIDESGIIDDEKIYYITGKKRPYPKGSILLVKDGASIGKTGILPYDAYVMQGIATLICRSNVDESLKYYVFATLKSSLYKRVIEALGYGATVQYSITKDEIESLEIPVIEEIAKDVSRYMKEFVENMYQANVLKKQAVMELENYILKLLG